MRAADLHGVVRGRAKRTTIPGKDGPRAGDLVDRAFFATAPNQLWVGDFTYVRTRVGFTYVAFIIDVFSRMMVGWKADTTMRADLVTDTLEMAVWARGRAGVTDLTGLIHHTDAGSQYVSLALTERLAALGMRPSIGTVGDAYDCEQNQMPLGRSLTRAYDWPWCLGVDLSAPAGWRSTHTPAGREGGDRIGA